MGVMCWYRLLLTVLLRTSLAQQSSKKTGKMIFREKSLSAQRLGKGISKFFILKWWLLFIHSLLVIVNRS